MVPQDGDERIDHPVILGVDVDPHPGEFGEQVSQAWDGLPAVDPGVDDLGPRQVNDAPRPVGAAVQGLVVEGEDHAVGSGVDVGLEVPIDAAHSV